MNRYHKEASIIEHDAINSRESLIARELDKKNVTKGFHLVYQPQVNIQTRTLVGFEALIRWSNNDLGSVSPGEFIPIAEGYNSINKITTWVINESLETIRYWLDHDFIFNRLSFNIAINDLKTRGFRERLLQSCRRYGVEPSYIGIEITERQPLNLDRRTKDIINDLKNDGFDIILDDFGSGYANFDTLHEFYIHTIKVDKVMIDNIIREDFQKILGGILSLASSLDMYVIIEGVETKQQCDILDAIGFHVMQGYYFSKPLNKESAMLFEIP